MWIVSAAQLFVAHPELAPMNPLSMTRESHSEQARLNLTSDTNEFAKRLAERNTRYRDKFKFPFITALVRHADMHSVMSELEARLSGNRKTEIKRALEEVVAVSSSRVEALFASNSPCSSADTAAEI